MMNYKRFTQPMDCFFLPCWRGWNYCLTSRITKGLFVGEGLSDWQIFSPGLWVTFLIVLFFFRGGGYFELMDFLNGISQGKRFDFIIEDFRFVCLQTEMHFFCECVCVFRDCKILGVELGSSSILIPVWCVFTLADSEKDAPPFSLQTVEFVQRTCIHLYRKELGYCTHAHTHEHASKW